MMLGWCNWRLIMIIRKKNKWRCVIADKDYVFWETIEVCECITMPRKDLILLQDTVLKNYVFGMKDVWHIVLWNGSLYNHSENSNILPVLLEWWRFEFIASRDIMGWEELTINYWKENVLFDVIEN